MNVDWLMTSRQKKIYDWMVAYAKKHQRPPTIREIGNEFGIVSPNGVASHLKALEKKGVIRIHGGVARGIQFVQVDQKKNLEDAVLTAAVEMVELGDECSFEALKTAVRAYRNGE